MAGEALVTDFSLEIYRGTPDGDHQGGILDQVIEVFYAATDFPPPQRPHYRGRVPEVVDRGAPELLGGAGRVPHILIQSLREVQDLVIVSRVLLVPGHDLWRRRRVAAVRDGDPPPAIVGPRGQLDLAFRGKARGPQHLRLRPRAVGKLRGGRALATVALGARHARLLV